MKILAWDTSSQFGSICAVEAKPDLSGFEIRAEFSLGVEAAHSERLLWAIHQTLEACRWTVQDVDAFAVGVGPGSFTGLRIGITTGRTLAHSLNKPLFSFSSLAAMVRPYCENLVAMAGKKSKIYVLAETDACKGEWFFLLGEAKELLLCRHADGFSKVGAQASGSGLWRKSVREDVLRPEACLEEFKLLVKNNKAHWVILGDDWTVDHIEGLPKARRLEPASLGRFRVLPRYAGIIAFEAIQNRAKSNPLEVHPRYLRVADAEKKLNEGLLKKNGPTRGLDG